MAILRTPSPKKSFKAKTTGRIKRSVKKSLPGYGQKGMGWAKDPKRAAYNKVYRKTTVGIDSGSAQSGNTEQSSTLAVVLSLLFAAYVVTGFSIGFAKATAIFKFIVAALVIGLVVYYGYKIVRFFKD